MKEPRGHILFLGYTPSARAAMNELGDVTAEKGITILSRRDVPERDGVTHLRLDYLDVSNLRDKRVGLQTCSTCVVFAEASHDSDHASTVDMHTVLAVYNVRQERPDLPVIAEVLDRENTVFIDELSCRDVIYKETIDSNLITSCVLHPHISPIFYDLLTIRGKKLLSTTIEELGMTEKRVTYRDIRLKGLEQDVTYLGFVDPSGDVKLMPPNETIIKSDHQLVYIQ